jgi:hypothetical protein
MAGRLKDPDFLLLEKHGALAFKDDVADSFDAFDL